MINFVFMLRYDIKICYLNMIFDTMRHYSTLCDTIRHYFDTIPTLFPHYSTLFDTIWHYSILFDTISTLFRHYSTLFRHYFDTIRHYFGISLTPFRHYSTLFRCEISLAGVPIRTHWREASELLRTGKLGQNHQILHKIGFW